MPDDVSVAVGNTGSAASFTFRDETYTLHKLTDKLRAKYTGWIHRELIRQLVELKSAYPPADYAEQLRLLQEQIGLKRYVFGTPASETIANSEDGNIAFFMVLFDDPRVNEKLVREMFIEKGDELNALYYSLHPKPADNPPNTEDGESPKG